jgi:hypothetical protein
MTTVGQLKQNVYKSLGLAAVATAAAFLGLDATIGNTVGDTVSRVLPRNLVDPVVLGGIVFCVGLVYTSFLDDRVESFFRSVY